MNDLGLVEAVDRLGESVVVGISDTADGGIDAGLGQTLGVADADILRPTVRMMNQAAAMSGPSFMQRLFESFEDEARIAPSGSPASRRCDERRRL